MNIITKLAQLENYYSERSFSITLEDKRAVAVQHYVTINHIQNCKKQ